MQCVFGHLMLTLGATIYLADYCGAACTSKLNTSSNIDLEAGTRKTFFCEYSGCSSKQSFTWYIDNKSVSGASNHETVMTTTNNVTTTTYKGTSSYTYTPKRPTDSSNIVRVVCKVNKRNYTISVNVQYGPDEVTLSKSGMFDYVENSSTESVVCTASCNPICTLQFNRNGQKFVSDGVLKFSRIMRTDRGSYNCDAKNQFGTKTSVKYVFFNVLYPPLATLSHSPSSSLLEEYIGPVVFNIYASGNPSNYSFSSCNHTINGVIIREIDVVNTSSPSLMKFEIRNLTYKDGGKYSCGVTNGIRDSTSRMMVEKETIINVKTKPMFEAKRITKVGGLWNITLDFLSLELNPHVSWYYDVGKNKYETVNYHSMRSTAKQNVYGKDINFASYSTYTTTSKAGRYITIIRNDMGQFVTEHNIESKEEESDSSIPLLIVSSLFLVISGILIVVAVLIFIRIKRVRTKFKRTRLEQNRSFYQLPSAEQLHSAERTTQNRQGSLSETELAENTAVPISGGRGTYIDPLTIKNHPHKKGAAKHELNYENHNFPSSSKTTPKKYLTILPEKKEEAAYYDSQGNISKVHEKTNKIYENQNIQKQENDTNKAYANVRVGQVGQTYENTQPSA